MTHLDKGLAPETSDLQGGWTSRVCREGAAGNKGVKTEQAGRLQLGRVAGKASLHPWRPSPGKTGRPSERPRAGRKSPGDLFANNVNMLVTDAL